MYLSIILHEFHSGVIVSEAYCAYLMKSNHMHRAKQMDEMLHHSYVIVSANIW